MYSEYSSQASDFTDPDKSLSLLLGRHLGQEFNAERYGQVEEIAQWLHGVDNAPEETGIRSKLKRFWKKTRIPSVIRKVVAGSKQLLIRLHLRQSPQTAPHESVEPDNANEASQRAVKRRHDMTHSPVSSSNEDTSTPPRTTPEVDTSPLSPILEPAPYESVNKKSFSKRRYKEAEPGTENKFADIQVGVVSTRVKWLEPILSGEKAEKVDSSQRESVDVQEHLHVQSGETCETLEKDSQSGLVPRMAGDSVDSGFSESEDDSGFDDSPRLFKHRLPEEEPKPWVEPGTVAKGAMWLEPVMSGEKGKSSQDRNPGNLTSPTRVSHGIFW